MSRFDSAGREVLASDWNALQDIPAAVSALGTSQTATFVLAGPTPSFRALAAADLPSNKANPSATAGLTAVNGVALTWMASDSAPPISQAITPTWTGQHIFANGSSAAPPALAGASVLISSAANNVAASFYGPTSGASGFNINFYDTTNGAYRAFIGFGTSTISGAGVGDFGIAPGAAGRVLIGTANGAAIGTIFDASGNVGFHGTTPPSKPAGYGTPTGNALTSSFAASSITLANLAAEVAQLIIDLKSYGIIGS